MDPILSSSLVGAGGGILSGIIGKIGNKKLIELQKKQWEREDTAIQRRVEDLRAAGLSPTLASGQGAASQPPSAGIEAAAGLQGRVSKGFETALMAQNYAKTVIDTDFAREKLQQEKHTTRAMEIMMDETKQIEGERVKTGRSVPLGQLTAEQALRQGIFESNTAELRREVEKYNLDIADLDYQFKKHYNEWKVEGYTRAEMELMSLWHALETARHQQGMTRDQAYMMWRNRQFYENFAGGRGISPVALGATLGGLHKGVSLGAGLLLP